MRNSVRLINNYLNSYNCLKIASNFLYVLGVVTLKGWEWWKRPSASFACMHTYRLPAVISHLVTAAFYFFHRRPLCQTSSDTNACSKQMDGPWFPKSDQHSHFIHFRINTWTETKFYPDYLYLYNNLFIRGRDKCKSVVFFYVLIFLFIFSKL